MKIKMLSYNCDYFLQNATWIRKQWLRVFLLNIIILILGNTISSIVLTYISSSVLQKTIPSVWIFTGIFILFLLVFSVGRIILYYCAYVKKGTRFLAYSLIVDVSLIPLILFPILMLPQAISYLSPILNPYLIALVIIIFILEVIARYSIYTNYMLLRLNRCLKYQNIEEIELSSNDKKIRKYWLFTLLSVFGCIVINDFIAYRNMFYQLNTIPTIINLSIMSLLLYKAIFWSLAVYYCAYAAKGIKLLWFYIVFTLFSLLSNFFNILEIFNLPYSTLTKVLCVAFYIFSWMVIIFFIYMSVRLTRLNSSLKRKRIKKEVEA